MFLINETVRSGDVTARVKNFYSANGLLVITDIKGGTIEAGMTVTGDCSGFSKTFTTFEQSIFFDVNFNDYEWEPDFWNMISLDDGTIVTLDDDRYRTSNCFRSLSNYNLNTAIIQGDANTQPYTVDYVLSEQTLAENDV